MHKMSSIEVLRGDHTKSILKTETLEVTHKLINSGLWEYLTIIEI